MDDDRADMVKVLDNDVEFDRWLAQMHRKREKKSAPSSSKSSPGKRVVSKEEYFKRMGGVHG
jgi:hypothetical protein